MSDTRYRRKQLAKRADWGGDAPPAATPTAPEPAADGDPAPSATPGPDDARADPARSD